MGRVNWFFPPQGFQQWIFNPSLFDNMSYCLWKGKELNGKRKWPKGEREKIKMESGSRLERVRGRWSLNDQHLDSIHVRFRGEEKWNLNTKRLNSKKKKNGGIQDLRNQISCNLVLQLQLKFNINFFQILKLNLLCGYQLFIN